MVVSRKDKERQEARKTDASAWAKQQSKGGGNHCYKLPEGVEEYKLTPGTHLIDIMPYKVGEGNPHADEGFEHFERTYDHHRIPGASGNSETYCCLWKTFGEPCPVCQWMITNAQRDPATVKALRGSTRHLWNVNDDPGKTKNAIKVLSTGHFDKGNGFGEQLADAISTVEKYGRFADLEGGMSLQLLVKESTFPGGKYNVVTRMDFIEREYDYPPEMLKKAVCLDECLVKTSFSDLENLIVLGQAKKTSSGENGEKEERSSRSVHTTGKRRQLPAEEEEEDGQEKDDLDSVTAEDRGIEEGQMVEHSDYGECEVLSVSKDGTSLKLQDIKGHVRAAQRPGDCTVIEEEETEEEETPRRPKKPGKKPVAEEEKETEEEPEEEEEEEEKPRRRGKKPAVEEEEEEWEDESPLEEEEEKPHKKPGKKKPAAKEEEEEWEEEDEEEEEEKPRRRGKK